ncbi:hypothetical protein ACLHZ0_21375 [Aeromonas salmonicida]|uniref:hypothetical protein n=1 Tax=Aeromonas salmonicida TaxID=645 RepID=UPI003D03FC5D
MIGATKYWYDRDNRCYRYGKRKLVKATRSYNRKTNADITAEQLMDSRLVDMLNGLHGEHNQQLAESLMRYKNCEPAIRLAARKVIKLLKQGED